jgi:hypothetical protein
MVLVGCSFTDTNTSKIEIYIKNHSCGAPITMGIPFPEGVLKSPDQIRLLDENGFEIPAQFTEVNRWDKNSNSIKWIWLFFFAQESDKYYLEYGEDVASSPLTSSRIRVINNMRHNGFLEIDTGPMRIKIDKTGNGFLDIVEYDTHSNGFDNGDTIASSPLKRGTFLDLLDTSGVDHSEANILRTRVLRGSGPMHLIARIDGEYQYQREDNSHSPFTIYLHAYAGKSYIKIYHTMTYTGDPDMYPPINGQHALIATSNENIIDEKSLAGDKRWLQPNDQIKALGLALNYHLEHGQKEVTTAMLSEDWWQPGPESIVQLTLDDNQNIRINQQGPVPNKIYPYETSSPDTRIEGFQADLQKNGSLIDRSERATGWLSIKDKNRGITVGMRHFFEEYPSELKIEGKTGELSANIWPDSSEPANFARYTAELDGGMVDNFASGISKTSELIYYFHSSKDSIPNISKIMNYVLNPPVAHTENSWYADSKVFGNIAPVTNQNPEYERYINYKFKWMAFNQNWEAWYGLFDYGDRQTYFYNMEWMLWNNNEPGQDYMRWLHFIRSGDREIYLEAMAASRHSMDVDNVHWPKNPEYIGDSNYTIDFFKFHGKNSANPYLGIGARESRSHWTTKYSAHVWVAGWLMDYYLNGYHRGLDIAKQTGETYLKRIWGDHDLTGRRLYLAVWNIAEIYDATKDPRYLADLKERVNRILHLQQEQGGNMVLDRYGYSQAYAMNGLRKYLQIESDPQVIRGIVQHARWVRDVPPRNHSYESYLATITSLLMGYQYSGEKSLLDEAISRSKFLIADEITDKEAFSATQTQRALYELLEKVDHMPERADGQRPNWKLNQGTRVFGWTHAYNVPYLLYYLTTN